MSIFLLESGNIMKTAQLKIGDKTLELPIITGTENEKAIDVG